MLEGIATGGNRAFTLVSYEFLKTWRLHFLTSRTSRSKE
jgi:hypothetical protein